MCPLLDKGTSTGLTRVQVNRSCCGSLLLKDLSQTLIYALDLYKLLFAGLQRSFNEYVSWQRVDTAVT